MTSKITGNGLSASATHKVEYAVQKRRPVMLPRRNSASSNAIRTAKENRELKRIVTKHPIENSDTKFYKSTRLRTTKDSDKKIEDHCLRRCSRKIAVHEWSQGDVTHENKGNSRITKFLNNHKSLPIGITNSVHSGSGIKPLMISDNRRTKPLSASKNVSTINAVFSDIKNESKLNTSKDDYEFKSFANRIVKKTATRNQPKNILKPGTQKTFLPKDKTEELKNMPRNNHITNHAIPELKSSEKEPKLYHAAAKTSKVKLKSVSQYQVKQKYKRSSIHLKPFSMFFKKPLSNNVSSLQFDVTSTVNCIKEEALLPEKHLPNSENLSCLYQNIALDLNPEKKRSFVNVIYNVNENRRHENETAACIAKNSSICSHTNSCTLTAESKKYGKTPISLSSTFHIKHMNGKGLQEYIHCKKTHRKKNNCNKSTEALELSCPLQSKMMISQNVTSKNIFRNDRNISLRPYNTLPQSSRDKDYNTDSRKGFGYSFIKDCNNDEAVSLRHYIKSSQTKKTAINITSSLNFRVDIDNDHTITPVINFIKKPEYRNKTIISSDGSTALNKPTEASSISFIKAVYSKLFPIIDTRKKEKKNVLKEVPVSRKMSVNKHYQNKDSSTYLIDKQVLGGNSKIVKVRSVENDSILKRCFCFIFNKLAKDRLFKPDNQKNDNTIELRNVNEKSGNTHITIKEKKLLESRDFNPKKRSIAFKMIKNTPRDRNMMKKQETRNIGFRPLIVYSEHPAEKQIVSNKYETLNYHKLFSHSNISFNVKLSKGFHNSGELKTKLNRQMVPEGISSQSLYNQGDQKKCIVNPIVMSLLHKTKHTNNKSEKSNIDLKKMETWNNVLKVKPKNYDDSLAFYEHCGNTFKATSNVSILQVNPDFGENLLPTESKNNTSIKIDSNRFSALKLNKSFRSNGCFLSSHVSSIPNIKDNDLKRKSPAFIKNSKTSKSQIKSTVTAAYCHVTYDKTGKATCERDITCAPQCDWIVKKGKRVNSKAHVIDNFCPFEDRNFMIQPCVIDNQENNKNKHERKKITENKCNFLKKRLVPKKCGCVCSRGDSRVNEKKNPNTGIKPKLSIAVDCNTMNIKNREEVLKKVIKLRDQEEEEALSQGRNKSPCCCTSSQPKSLRCMSCNNIPNQPTLKQTTKQTIVMKNEANEPPLEIKMDSDSNILNRKEVMERIKKIKHSRNAGLQGKRDTGLESHKVINVVKNKLVRKPVCVCKNEVCSRDSEEEYKKREEAQKKEKQKPCVCGAPSCERISIQKLVNEGKLSKKDGKIILAMIKKQEQLVKQEELREQKRRVLRERKRIKEQHMKKRKKKGKQKKKKKLTAKAAMKGKLTQKEMKKLPKDQRELLEQSAKKESIAQKETKKIKIAMQKQQIEDAERKVKEDMQERQQAADLEMKFKRQMLADDRKEKKGLRKKLFAERIKRAKEGRIKKMQAQKRKRQLELKKQKQKLRERIEDEELKKQKETQQIMLAEKERVYREKQARKKKEEKMQEEKLQMKKRDQALKLKLLKEKQKRAEMIKKKKEKEKKLKMEKIRKENKRFLKEMGKIAAAERKKQKKEAKRKQQLKLQRHEFMRTEIRKYRDADDRYLVKESLKETAACCIKYTGKFFGSLMYSAKHPKLTYKKIRRAYLQPGEVATDIQKSWSESEVHDIANRIEAKILAIDQLQPIGKKLYDKPKKQRPPKRRFKKRKRNRRAPMDFGCSLYMASLRRKPYFFLYWMCPWFYPHLISMLKVLRQVADLGLFILAIFVWSPFILLWEIFRTIMCCGLCTA